MGNGDFRPNGTGWQIVTVLYSLAGFGLLTATITYFTPVLSAAIRGQRLAVSISLMGRTPTAILCRSWNGDSFNLFEQEAQTLRNQLIQHSRSHLAYPVIHYFDSSAPEASAIRNLAAIDEALTTILHAGRQSAEELPQIQLLRQTMDSYLDTVLNDSVIEDAQNDPGEWRDVDPTDSDLGLDPEKVRLLGDTPEVRERRHLLQNLLACDGWRVRDVVVPI